MEQKILPLILTILTLGFGCGPSTLSAIRLETTPAPGNSGRLSQEGLVVEVPDIKELPPSLTATVARCKEDGTPVMGREGKPVAGPVAIIPPGYELYQVKLSNQTDHVIRLMGAVIRLFDPGENQIEPQSREDVMAATEQMLGKRGICPTEGPKLKEPMRTIRFIGPNSELLPGTTTTGWIVFLPIKLDLPGTWKFVLYDVPVKTDAAGNVTQKARFEFAYQRKQLRDTFEQNSWTGERKLLRTEEVH